MSHRKAVLAIFILSGAAGLIYEVVWARQLSGADVARFARKGPLITDDRPLTEYFLLRRLIGPESPPVSEGNLRSAMSPGEVVIGARGTGECDISKD
jgi:hypothetical protein